MCVLTCLAILLRSARMDAVRFLLRITLTMPVRLVMRFPRRLLRFSEVDAPIAAFHLALNSLTNFLNAALRFTRGLGGLGLRLGGLGLRLRRAAAIAAVAALTAFASSRSVFAISRARFSRAANAAFRFAFAFACRRARSVLEIGGRENASAVKFFRGSPPIPFQDILFLS